MGSSDCNFRMGRSSYLSNDAVTFKICIPYNTFDNLHDKIRKISDFSIIYDRRCVSKCSHCKSAFFLEQVGALMSIFGGVFAMRNRSRFARSLDEVI